MRNGNWGRRGYVLILLIFLLKIFLISSVWAEEIEDILRKMDDVGKYKTARMGAAMEIVDRKGGKTSMSLISFEKKEGEKSLMRFTRPARLKGTAILSVGDNIWYYNNRTNRVRLLSKSAKKARMMGSSFSYEDISSNYVKNYTGKINKEKRKEYILKLFPKDKGKTFKYLLVTVSKKTYVASRTEYYNYNNLIYKVLTSEKVKEIDGHLVPLILSMKEIGNQKITNFIIDEKAVEFDIPLTKNLFSERYLKK